MKIGESGIIFRVNTGFDMSSSTALELLFTAPDGTESSITNPRVSAPASAVTDPDLGDLNANEYMEFLTESTDFTQSGVWSVCSKFTNTTPEPDQVYIGDQSAFTVTEC